LTVDIRLDDHFQLILPVVKRSVHYERNDWPQVASVGQTQYIQ